MCVCISVYVCTHADIQKSFAPSSGYLLSLSNSLSAQISPQRDTYFISFSTSRFAFFSFENFFKSKTLSMMCSHCRRSLGSSFALNSETLALTSFWFGYRLLPLLGLLWGSSSLGWTTGCWSFSVYSSWAEACELEELTIAILFCFVESPSWCIKYAF